jgi:hypothetical protein
MFQLNTTVVAVDVRNNIFYNAPRTAGAGPSIFEFTVATGTIHFAGPNWVSPGWLNSQAQELGQSFNGTITGTGNFISPSNNNLGLVDAAAFDAHLTSASGALNKAGPLAAAARSHPVNQEYVYHQRKRPRPVHGTAPDLGAFGY